jgi:hypothetical protein
MMTSVGLTASVHVYGFIADMAMNDTSESSSIAC